MLDETELINFQVEKHDLGLADMGFYSYLPDMEKIYTIEDCWMTWTVPFDKENGYYFLATAYYMSQPVINFWEEKLDGRVMWFVTDLGGLSTMLENAEQEMKPSEVNSKS